MRLNRVLLLAATINILIFALAFTISCSSGEDGPKGRDADHCVVNDDWDIVCTDNAGNKTYPGQLEGGNGPKGPTGQTGKKGDGCWLGDKVGSGYQVLCGPSGAGEVKGTLDGCVIGFKGDYEVDITCGPTSLGLCSGKGFNPDSAYCDQSNNRFGDVKQLDFQNDFAYCGKQKYNIKRQYCGFTEKDVGEGAEASTVYDICGINIKPNELSWKKEFCQYINEKTPKKGEVTADPYTTGWCEDGNPINKDSWKGEYCGFKDRNATKRTLLTGACDNQGPAVYSYKKVSEASSDNWALVPNGGAYGPNQVAFGQGYCEVKFANKKDLKTTYSEQLCGTSTSNKPNNGKWNNEYCGYASKDDKIPSKIFNDMCDDGSRPSGGNFDGTKGDYYYQYVSEAISSGKILIASAGNALFEVTTNHDNFKYGSLMYSRESQYGAASAGFNEVKGGTKYFCGWANKNGTTPGGNVIGTTLIEACPVQNRSIDRVIYTHFNKTKWNGDYCGFSKSKTSNTSSFTDITKRDTLYLAGLCDDGKGAYGRAYNTSNNTGAGVSVDRNGEENGTAPGLWEGFCKWNKNTEQTELSVAFCNKKPVPKGSYCGAPTDKVSGYSNDSVYTGVCGDGYGPNSFKFNTRFCGYKFKDDKTTSALILCGTSGSRYNVNSWVGDYCGYDYGENYKTDGSTPLKPFNDKNSATYPDKLYQKSLCGDGLGPFDSTSTNPVKLSGYKRTMETGKLGGYCTQIDVASGYSVLVPATDVCYVGGKTTPINVGSWKGEYCVGIKGTPSLAAGATGYIEPDQKVLPCKAGWEPKDLDDKATSCVVPTPEQKIICEELNWKGTDLPSSGAVYWNDRSHKCIWNTASFGDGSTKTAISTDYIIDYKKGRDICGNGVGGNGGNFVISEGLCYRGQSSVYKSVEICKENGKGTLTPTAGKLAGSPTGKHDITSIALKGEGENGQGSSIGSNEDDYKVCGPVVTSNPNNCQISYASSGPTAGAWLPSGGSSIGWVTQGSGTWPTATASTTDVYYVKGTCELKLQNPRKIARKK